MILVLFDAWSRLCEEVSICLPAAMAEHAQLQSTLTRIGHRFVCITVSQLV